jgi:tetratricopeptide (TPR) repeat protein
LFLQRSLVLHQILSKWESGMKKIFLACLISLFGTSMVHAATAQDYISAGNQFYQAKDLNKAVLYYKAAVQMDPNNAAAHQSLGSAYYGLGQKPEALAEYQKSLAINPNNPQLSSFVQTLQAQVGSTPSMPGMGGTTPSSASSAAKNLEVDPMAGIALGGGAGMGIGGGVSGYYLLDKSLGIGASVGFYSFSSVSLTSIDVMASGKYYFQGDSLKPYILLGLGMSMLSSGGLSTSNPVVAGGGGIKLSLGGELMAFAEAKYCSIFSSVGSGSYEPIGAGLSFNF